MATSRLPLLGGIAAAAATLGVAALTLTASATAAPADDEFLIPNTSTFDPTGALGYPPVVDVLQGSETWNLTGAPSGTYLILVGVDTHTTFGSFTNDDFLASGGITASSSSLSPGFDTEVDVFNFGGGFENEWINVTPSAIPDGATPGISDLLITPLGNFELLGTYFSDLVAP